MASAHEEWDADCGPLSLAFALQVSLESIRHHVAAKMSPSMMKFAIEKIGQKFSPVYNIREPRWWVCESPIISMFHSSVSLVSVEWSGCGKGHWIVCWKEDGRCMVWDCNCGTLEFSAWENKVVPLIVANYLDSDGRWFPTNILRFAKGES